MNRIACDLCGNDNYGVIDNFSFMASKLTLVKCHKCGLTYVNPRLTFEERNKYFQQYMADSGDNANWWEEYRRPNFNKDLKLLKKFSSRGKLLDVGCGHGVFIKEAEKTGWDVCGVEVSKAPSVYARKKLSLKVYNCTLEDVAFPSGSFNAVTILDVIGYLQSPAGTISEINRVLKQNGIIIIRTLARINHLKVYKKIMRILGKTKNLDNNPFFETDRNYHFSTGSIKKLLKSKGFGNIEIYNARMGHWQSESYAVKIIRRIYMFVADVVCSGTFGAICLAPSITVVAKKK